MNMKPIKPRTQAQIRAHAIANALRNISAAEAILSQSLVCLLDAIPSEFDSVVQRHMKDMVNTIGQFKVVTNTAKQELRMQATAVQLQVEEQKYLEIKRKLTGTPLDKL